jgi:hypothetical protein
MMERSKIKGGLWKQTKKLKTRSIVLINNQGFLF